MRKLPVAQGEEITVATHANPDWTGWSLALASTFASAIVTPLARGVVLDGLHPLTLLLLRLLIAMAIMVTTTALWEPAHFKLDGKTANRLFWIGLISGIEICCFFWSLAFVDASMTAMIKSTQPLVVLLMLNFGGERLTRQHILRLGLAMIGVYLLVGPGGRVEPLGLLLLSFSLLFYACQLVFTQWWLAEVDTRTIAFYLNLIMLLVIVCWWWLQGVGWQSPSPFSWLVIVVLAVVSTYLARLALFGAIQRIGSGQLSLLWPLQTLLVIVLSYFFLDERMTATQWLGGGFVLISALLVFQRNA